MTDKKIKIEELENTIVKLRKCTIQLNNRIREGSKLNSKSKNNHLRKSYYIRICEKFKNKIEIYNRQVDDNDGSEKIKWNNNNLKETVKLMKTIRDKKLKDIVKNLEDIDTIKINKAIENREDLIKENLGEMIQRIMDKRRSTIKSDSAQKIIGNKVTIMTKKSEILRETRNYYEEWK